MKDCINIGLLGVGTVGSGVLHVLEHNGGEIAKKAGCKIEIKIQRDEKQTKIAHQIGDGKILSSPVLFQKNHFRK